MTKKVTEFIGYMSGDNECFCLMTVPFKVWVKHGRKMPLREKGEKAFWDWDKEHNALMLYSSKFFPEECKEGKWKFKITIEATKVDESKNE